MQRAENIEPLDVGNVGSATDHTPRITDNHGWMPTSGYGQYCTIPFSSGIDGAMLTPCGFPSFAGARREIQLLSEEYADRAAALVAKAKRERLQLSLDVRGPAGEVLIRPHRLRLSLDMHRQNGYLYLGWRGVVWQRIRWARDRPPRLWDCTSDLARLVAGAHPDEKALVARIEAEAVEIRRRWFALVRAVHYMNVTEGYRLSDLESGVVHPGRGYGRVSIAMQWLRRVFGFRMPKS